MKKKQFDRISALVFSLGVVVLGSTPAFAESVLRVAMTTSDIPDWTGAPDQGMEGNRFAGWTLYDALVNWDLSKADVVADIKPGLAESWAIDPNNHKRWLFKLRKGVRFHDGCEWNADAAVWNFQRIMDPNAPQYNARHSANQGWQITNVESVDKVDDLTIALNTKIPDSFIPYEIAGVFQISKCALDASQNNYDEFAKNPQGSGPYRFDRIVPHQRLELVKNPDYWDQNRVPKHDRLVLLPMPEASTRVAALLAGQVDFVEAPAPDAIPRLKEAGMQIVSGPYPHNWDYQVRTDKPPFDDLRVRQAANYAINRNEIVELLQGLATPGNGKFIPSQPWYGNPMQYGYDPEKAKALLAEAGCQPCEISIGISTSGSGQMQPLPMNELVKEQLEAVGFKVNLVAMDWNSLLTSLFAGAKKGDLSAINVSMAAPEPVGGLMKSSLTRYIPPEGYNWGGYSNPKADELGAQALAEFDIAKRDALVAQLHEMLVADAYNIFIVHDLNPRALSPKVKGFVQAQSWIQDLTPIEVQP